MKTIYNGRTYKKVRKYFRPLGIKIAEWRETLWSKIRNWRKPNAR